MLLLSFSPLSFPPFQVCHSVMSVSGVCAGTLQNMRQRCVSLESQTLTTLGALRLYTIYTHTSFLFLGFHATLSVEAIFGQLHNLISLFSLVSFTVKTECNRISHTAANGHEGWEERYTVNCQGWREGVLHRDPSTSNKKQMCELCVCSRLAPYSCCPPVLPKRNCCWQAADRRGFHAISRV